MRLSLQTSTNTLSKGTGIRVHSLPSAYLQCSKESTRRAGLSMLRRRATIQNHQRIIQAHPKVKRRHQPIFIQKFDYSDAYRRVHHHWKAASQTILVVGNIAYLFLRLAFGGSPNQACFCAFSEALTDVANDLANWTKKLIGKGSALISKRYTIPKQYGGPDEEFAQGIKPAFEDRSKHTSRKDCFIDDVVNTFLDDPESNKKECHAVPLAVDALSRPHGGEKK